MSDTRDDVVVPNATWTDLYAASGIAVGTAVEIINKGSSACVIAIKATAPSTTTVGFPLFVGPVGNSASIEAGETGLWAYCAQGSTRLLVQD